MTEKLSLQWNEFQENIISVFGRLRDDKNFTDVTLACEDGQQLEAHRLILIASSPFFENILKRNKHSHPLIYLKGFQSQDLVAIIDFLYFGEANVLQENLNSFLEIATELKLKGLASPKTTEEIRTETTHNNSFNNELAPNVDPIENVSTALTTLDESSGELQTLDERVKSMMKKSQNMVPAGTLKRTKASICRVCGKEGHPKTIQDHIEAKHLEGISIPCALCGKTCPSRNALISHKSRYHRAEDQVESQENTVGTK